MRSDENLQRLAATELAELLGIRGEPVLSELARWPHAMPQYHVGHCELVARIESRGQRSPTSPWPATPSTAWACRIASAAGSWRRNGSPRVVSREIIRR